MNKFFDALSMAGEGLGCILLGIVTIITGAVTGIVVGATSGVIAGVIGSGFTGIIKGGGAGLVVGVIAGVLVEFSKLVIGWLFGKGNEVLVEENKEEDTATDNQDVNIRDIEQKRANGCFDIAIKVTGALFIFVFIRIIGEVVIGISSGGIGAWLVGGNVVTGVIVGIIVGSVVGGIRLVLADESEFEDILEWTALWRQ